MKHSKHSKETYLKQYSLGARWVKRQLTLRGWAQAKGETKRIVVASLWARRRDDATFAPGFIDALLDSVN